LGRRRPSGEGDQLGRVVVTTDQDFLSIAAAWQKAGRPFVGIIFGHQLRTRVGQTIADLELLSKAGEVSDFQDRVFHLPV
jgi:hypothetical protein